MRESHQERQVKKQSGNNYNRTTIKKKKQSVTRANWCCLQKSGHRVLGRSNSKLQSQPGSPPRTHKSPSGRVCRHQTTGFISCFCVSLSQNAEPCTLSKKVPHKVQRARERKPAWTDLVLSGTAHDRNQSHSRKWVSVREERDMPTKGEPRQRPGCLWAA